MMKPEALLAHIFSLVRRAPEPPRDELPFGLETAVLAHWRAARAQMTPAFRLLPRLRWAALVACAIAAFSVAWSREEFAEIAHLSFSESHIAESAMQVAYGND